MRRHVLYVPAVALLVAIIWPLALSRGLQSHQIPDDWPKISKAFLAAMASGNVEQLEKSARAVVADDSKRSVELVLKSLRTAAAVQYWTLIRSLAGCNSEESLSAIGDEVLTGKLPELRRDLVLCFRLSSSKATLPVLRRILKEGTPDLQVSAIDELVDKGDRDSGPLLLELADKDKSAQRELTRRIYRALSVLASETPPNSPAEWRDWWNGRHKQSESNPASAVPKKGVGETLVQSMRPLRATQFEQLTKGEKEQILVMSGDYDKVETVLDRFRIPYTLESFSTIKTSKEEMFEKPFAILLNCASVGDWPDKAVLQIRNYVARGGSLFVSDLGVLHLVRHAFPGIMQFKAGNLSAETVGIVPARGIIGHPLMRGVDLGVGEQRKPLWVIDEGGPALQFETGRVVALVESPVLMLKRKPPAVAVAFSYSNDKTQPLGEYGGVYEEFKNSGRVLCVLSHFEKQNLDVDGYTLQNLLINFLIEARDRKLMRDDAAGQKK